MWPLLEAPMVAPRGFASIILEEASGKGLREAGTRRGPAGSFNRKRRLTAEQMIHHVMNYSATSGVCFLQPQKCQFFHHTVMKCCMSTSRDVIFWDPFLQIQKFVIYSIT